MFIIFIQKSLYDYYYPSYKDCLGNWIVYS